MVCKCGKDLSENAKFCIECGRKAPEQKRVEENEVVSFLNYKLAFSVKEAAMVIGVSQFLIRELIIQGQLKHVRIGECRIVIRRETLDAFLKDRETNSCNI